MKRNIENLKIILTVIIMLSLFIQSCSKTDSWLDEKSNLGDVKPTTLVDFQAILDNATIMNFGYPGAGLTGGDNYYLIDQNYTSSAQYLRNSYIWAKDIFAGAASSDWTSAYKIIQCANIVLDGLQSIKKSSANALEYDRVKGSALFFRSYAYYTLSQTFCGPYTAASINDPGLVLRENSDVGVKSSRATIGETYLRMLEDISEAIDILSATSGYQTRPTRSAANGLMAKIQLSMDNYEEALKYSGDALAEFKYLLDFNNTNVVSTATTFRFPAYPGNPEILFYARQPGLTSTSASTTTLGYVDSTLYKSYENDDLRKTIFYQYTNKTKIQFRGNYSGTLNNFAGIATNEILLIHSECNARTGKYSDALDDLNLLLSKRYRAGKFVPLNISDPDLLLMKILEERRKELPFTGQLRWEDLRRLNKDQRFAKILVRIIAGTRYELLPKSKRYVFPIPDVELELSGISQNER